MPRSVLVCPGLTPGLDDFELLEELDFDELDLFPEELLLLEELLDHFFPESLSALTHRPLEV